MTTVGPAARFRLAQIFLRPFPVPHEPAQGALLILDAADDAGAGSPRLCWQ